jgi:hypothetical protein
MENLILNLILMKEWKYLSKFDFVNICHFIYISFIIILNNYSQSYPYRLSILFYFLYKIKTITDLLSSFLKEDFQRKNFVSKKFSNKKINKLYIKIQ